MALRPQYLDDLSNTIGFFREREQNTPLPDTPFEEPDDSYSFADADVSLILPWYQKGDLGAHVIKLRNISVFTLSHHKDKYPVTGLGPRNLRGFTYGNKVVAGSMGFVLRGNESVFQPALRKYLDYRGTSIHEAQYLTPDVLPPMDLIITMVSDAGNARVLWMKGLTITDRSSAIDVNQPQLNEVYSYMALDSTNWFVGDIK